MAGIQEGDHTNSPTTNQNNPTENSLPSSGNDDGGNPPYFDNEMPKKIADIDPNVFYTACDFLNMKNMKHDWRSLAGRLGYNVTDVRIFDEVNEKGGPAAAMLYDWSAKGHHYVKDVVKELKEMKRNDVAELLQREI